MPTEHAGGKWRLTYVGAKGDPGNLELDINFGKFRLERISYIEDDVQGAPHERLSDRELQVLPLVGMETNAQLM